MVSVFGYQTTFVLLCMRFNPNNRIKLVSNAIIEEIREKRLKWIDANRENDFESGISNLLTELYPDNAHFIYELLQNAEDANATKVSFTLDSEKLVCEHNGERKFSEKDVQSITSIGKSTKKDDVVAIGKFGVGFKSVFSYTKTPKVYSGEFAFEIHDLVCPSEIEQTSKGDSTRFEFPFNYEKKTKQDAFNEISEGLWKLPPNTILYLQNIQEIVWEIIEDDETFSNGHIKRSQIPNRENHFKIEKEGEEEIEETFWLRFDESLPDNEGLFVSIAFRLVKIEDTERFEIDANVDKGDVSIFFPAEKEVSGLRFFLHAPFVSTVARDSIQNRSENVKLRNLLVKLLIESLPKVKELNLLDVNFLAIMPNEKDSLERFYNPFREKIVNAFHNSYLTPTWRGEYKPAKYLYRAENEIRQVINRETILTELLEDKNADWLIDVQRDSRASEFMKRISNEPYYSYSDNKEVSKERLYEKVTNAFSGEKNANYILQKFSDEWMQKFYKLLNSIPYRNPFTKAFIVRLQDGTHVQGNNSYFQTGLVKDGKNINLVKAEIYKLDEAKRLLEKLGVKDYDEKDEIKAILKEHYSKDSLAITDEYFNHLEMFVSFWVGNQNETKIFSDYYFLRVESNEENKNIYAQPRQTYIDEPFEETSLSTIEKLINKSKLWIGYESEIKNAKNFVKFLKAVGVMSELEIIEIKTFENPLNSELRSGTYGAGESDYKVDKDYKIKGLEDLLQQKSYETSKIVWKTMCNANKFSFLASFRPNLHYSVKTVASQLIQTLQNFAWIPNKDKNFCKPQEMTKGILASDFYYNNDNGWLDEIGFGTEINKQVNEQQLQMNLLNRELKKRGLTIEELDELVEIKREKKLKEQRRSKSAQRGKTGSFDFANSPNFGNRTRTNISAERNIIAEYSNTKSDAREFLKSSYTNESHELICQICDEEMPFRLLNGEYYFEAVKIVGETKFDNIANYLCCCPNCAAMYENANQDKENIRELILDEQDEDKDILTVNLAENECEIIFKPEHFEQLLKFVENVEIEV